ncbi:MAG: oligosaccharide flippase family protein [Candidatus Pacearchaeota archaeon]
MKTKLIENILTLWGFNVISGVASALFYILMAYMLSVEQYGLFYSLVSLSYLFTIPQETIRTIISRVCAKLGEEKAKIKYVFSKYLKRMFFLGIAAFLIFLLAIPYLKALFKTSFLPLLLTGISLIFVFILPVIWGILQGTFRFKELGINNALEMILKLSFAIALVLILPSRLKVIGALIAIPASIFFTFLIGLFPIKDILKARKEKFYEKGGFRYALASLALFTLIGIMCVADVIIARYFFDEKTAGLYAGLSMIGTALFFIAMNAKRVMLPTIVKEKRKNPKKILAKTALTIGSMFFGFFMLSLIFPKNITLTFLGTKYLEVASLLKYVVLAYAFFSLSVLLVFYNLSINKNKRISTRILASGTFMLIALLILFHSNLMEFITMTLIAFGLTFVSLLIVSFRK